MGVNDREGASRLPHAERLADLDRRIAAARQWGAALSEMDEEARAIRAIQSETLYRMVLTA